MAFHDFYTTVARDERTAIDFMMQENMLRSEPPECPKCQKHMTIVKSGSGEGYTWRCPVHKGQKASVRKDSCWEKSNLPLCKLLELLFLWSFKTPVGDAEVYTGLSATATIYWYSRFREACSWWLVHNPYQIGGPGEIVEINENLVAKRKRHADDEVEERWVFGGICPATKRGFLQPIPDRSDATLLPLIQEHIAPGSIIHSDRHAVYQNITTIPVDPPYQHLMVKHDQDSDNSTPTTMVSTKKVKWYWKSCEHRFKAMAGVHNTKLESHLDEFMWREIHGKTPQDAWENARQLIAERYPTL